ncbi:macrolide family glycosyltransferase [Kitasatospora sp. HPMI-4]|uniref:macrolide family glycosyltransferase n=1 Tax=Kitasatospora sp. HPMI-4 TaxID=3448443 RepID=UPI003F1CF93A
MNIPAHGHVNPTLGLVTELAARGHRVSYAVSDDFAALVEEAGATPVRYRSTFPTRGRPDWAMPRGGDGTAVLRRFHDEYLAVLPQLAAAYDDDPPEAVVYDLAAAHAPVLAQRWGVPRIQLSPTHVLYEGFEQDLGIAPAAPDGAPAAAAAPPAPCLVMIPRSFQMKAERVPGHCTFVGPMPSERAVDGDWHAPDGRPVLLVSLGSVYSDRPEFLRACVEAFKDLDWHVVMPLGWYHDTADLGELPANFEVCRWVPQMKVLSRASAFVTAGGMGSTMEAITHRVPLVAVPQAADQLVTGARIEQLGLGRLVPASEATAARLREAVLAVAGDEEIARRLDAMRAEILESGGARQAADVIETHLRGAAR